jgi:hypothetical protein
MFFGSSEGQFTPLRKGATMSNTNPLQYNTGFHMRCDEEFLQDLDELRAQGRPLLSRADYVRKLVADAKTRAAKARKVGR